MPNGPSQAAEQSEVTIGDVVVSSEGDALVFHQRDQAIPGIRLDLEGVGELLDFLRSCAVNQSNQRRAFRVPVSRDCGVGVSVCIDGQTVAATPIDVSLIGTLIEITDPATGDLGVGDTILVNLSFEGKESCVRGEVKRCDGERYGIFFPGSMEGKEVKAPPDLVHIVMELQRRWLTHRVH